MFHVKHFRPAFAGKYWAIITLLTLCLLFATLALTGRSSRVWASDRAGGDFGLSELAPLQLSALHRPIVRMRLFVVVGARATEEEKDWLSVFSHDYLCPTTSSIVPSGMDSWTDMFRGAVISKSDNALTKAVRIAAAFASIGNSGERCPSIAIPNLRTCRFLYPGTEINSGESGLYSSSLIGSGFETGQCASPPNWRHMLDAKANESKSPVINLMTIEAGGGDAL
jgi:hypothetical protein